VTALGVAGGLAGLGWGGRILVSVVVGLLFAAAAVTVYALGEPLKRAVDDDIAEAFQSLFLTVAGILAAGLLVVVWDLQPDLRTALGAVAFDGRTAALVLVTLVVFGVAYTVTRITKRVVIQRARHDAISAHQREVAHHVVQVLVFVPTIMFVLALWGAEPGNLLIGAGAVGVIVGLAARQTLGAVLAGFVLLFARPFEIGDWVVVSEEEGTVTDVSVFNTEIRTFDNEHVLVPNDQVTATEIVNRSRNPLLRVTVDVGVDYDADPGEAAAVAEAAMNDCEEVLGDPTPDVVLSEFADSSVVLTLRFWIREPTIARKWAAQNAVVQSVKAAFEREGVGIPFPQRTVSSRPDADVVLTPGRDTDETDREGGAVTDDAYEDGDTDSDQVHGKDGDELEGRAAEAEEADETDAGGGGA
jgi:small-conductance mechanosensitive channel